MSYNPITDFAGLIRQTSGGDETVSLPGLDFVVVALARAGLISLSIGQTAPLVNQLTTAWFKPAQPSWTAEGTLFLWNATAQTYQVATPALWSALLSGNVTNYQFQSAGAPTNIINAGISLLAVQRVGPVATSLTLPNLNVQWASGRKLQIIDFSISVANHLITLVTSDGSTIMQQPSWGLLSTAVQLAGITLQPSPDLNAWIIAP